MDFILHTLERHKEAPQRPSSTGQIKRDFCPHFQLSSFLHPNGNRPGLTNSGHICLLYVTFKLTNFQEYITTFIYYRPPTKLLEGNLSVVCVCPPVCSQGRSHVTINHDALDCAGASSPDMAPHCTGGVFTKVVNSKSRIRYFGFW